MSKENWRKALKGEFGIHFKNSSGELGFLIAFIEDLIEDLIEKAEPKQGWEKELYEQDWEEELYILLDEMTMATQNGRMTKWGGNKMFKKLGPFIQKELEKQREEWKEDLIEKIEKKSFVEKLTGDKMIWLEEIINIIKGV